MCVFLEPIALYHRRTCTTRVTGRLLAPTPPPLRLGDTARGSGRACCSEGPDVLLVTIRQRSPVSLRAAPPLAEGIGPLSVLDLRWLAPLPVADLRRRPPSGVVVVDETSSRRRQRGRHGRPGGRRVPAGRPARSPRRELFIPLGPAAGNVLVSEEEIVCVVQALVELCCMTTAGGGGLLRECRLIGP